MARTVDVKTYEFAQHVFSDYAHHFGWQETDELTMKLARQIQDTAEDWCSDLENVIRAKREAR